MRKQQLNDLIHTSSIVLATVFLASEAIEHREDIKEFFSNALKKETYTEILNKAKEVKTNITDVINEKYKLI